MYPDISLREKVAHGTRQNPIVGMEFRSGRGTAYPNGFFVDRHWHSMVEILYVKRGQYLVEINLSEYVLEEGDICVVNSGDLHQITGKGTATVHEVVLFDPRILDFSYEDEWEEQQIAPFVNGTMIFRNVLRKWECCSDIRERLSVLIRKAIAGEPGWYVKCKLMILEWFDLMAGQQMLLPVAQVQSAVDVRKVGRYKTIISYMEKHYGEPISLQQLADTIPCNSQYLCRFFKEIAGVTPIQYLITYRIERACQMLQNTGKPILEVAMDCGFENISYFIRKFKEKKGCTPKEYRQNSLYMRQ